jgi:hypothetical protein
MKIDYSDSDTGVQGKWKDSQGKVWQSQEFVLLSIMLGENNIFLSNPELIVKESFSYFINSFN